MKKINNKIEFMNKTNKDLLKNKAKREEHSIKFFYLINMKRT